LVRCTGPLVGNTSSVHMPKGQASVLLRLLLS
jgi:hypothetical protein